MPLTGELTYAVNPEEIYFDGLRLQDSVCTQWAPKRFLAINATAHADFAIQIRNTRALGSIGANLASTARGIAIATFAAKARIWDLVAGAAIIHSAGGALCYLDGQPIDYLALLDGRVTPQPIIAAHPHLVSSITSRISPQPVY
ncbi:hypothetical protein KFU94_14435 [Chloroflexi bacterium TSY]|nr:hypothetical protein [Chloroflexi bacterium TSY]